VARVTGRLDLSLSEPAFDAATAATVVARMLRNLKAIYLRSQLFPAALPVLRRLVELSRGDPEERRDLGVSALRAGRPGEAIPHLAAYGEDRPNADDSEDIAALARVARRELSSRN
jgi:regulator of sirC expression with transglutaminase-like and TPR domain